MEEQLGHLSVSFILLILSQWMGSERQELKPKESYSFTCKSNVLLY